MRSNGQIRSRIRLLWLAPGGDRGTTMMRQLALVLVVLLPCVSAPAAEVAYYDLPAGAFPHDVAPAADGGVWYTDQHQGRLGKLDPKTGKVEQVPLGTGSAPHGVVIASDGAPWVTDGGQNAMVRVDPMSDKVSVFPLPKAF